MKNRSNKFDYKNAIENDLPIGSGEIESANKNIVQKRLKIPGLGGLQKQSNIC